MIPVKFITFHESDVCDVNWNFLSTAYNLFFYLSQRVFTVISVIVIFPHSWLNEVEIRENGNLRLAC